MVDVKEAIQTDGRYGVGESVSPSEDAERMRVVRVVRTKVGRPIFIGGTSAAQADHCRYCRYCCAPGNSSQEHVASWWVGRVLPGGSGPKRRPEEVRKNKRALFCRVGSLHSAAQSVSDSTTLPVGREVSAGKSLPSGLSVSFLL
jgi:hypothetical protein